MNRKSINTFVYRLMSLTEIVEDLRLRHDEDEPFENYDVRVAIRPRYGRDSRTHNAPDVAEVAICMDYDLNSVGRDIVVMPRQRKIEQVSEVAAAYDPLQYPVLFPLAESGWDFLMVQNPSAVSSSEGAKRLTLMQYTNYKQYQRVPFSPLHEGGKLSLQYWTDQYCRRVTNNLRWYRENQKKIRSDMYHNVHDAMPHDFDPTRAGQRIILPASYHGSDQHTSCNYQNSMALVRKFGKPDLLSP